MGRWGSVGAGSRIQAPEVCFHLRFPPWAGALGVNSKASTQPACIGQHAWPTPRPSLVRWCLKAELVITCLGLYFLKHVFEGTAIRRDFCFCLGSHGWFLRESPGWC